MKSDTEYDTVFYTVYYRILLDRPGMKMTYNHRILRLTGQYRTLICTRLEAPFFKGLQMMQAFFVCVLAPRFY